MIKWIKKLRAKWILYRIRHCKRYKRTVKVLVTHQEVKDAFKSEHALDEFMQDVINRTYKAQQADYLQLRIDAGEIITEDDTSEYPDIIGKYNI